MACKNLQDVFDNLQSVNQTSTSAQIEGVLCSLTEMQTPKKGTKRYFRGQVTDGTKKMRIVGFDEYHLNQLEPLDANRSPIKLSKCEVQRSSYSGDLEIKLTSKTNIGQSPKSLTPLQSPPTLLLL